MTRRDYILLSTALRRAHSQAESPIEAQGVRLAANEIGHAIAQRNLAFNYPQFMRDSGVIS